MNKDEMIMKMKQNRKIQQFFKDRVYVGIKDEKMVRKVYRGKRDKNGHRENKVFYVNSDQSFRISESMLIYYVELILKKAEMTDTDLILQSTDSKKQLFLIRQKDFLAKKHSIEEYRSFISEMLSNDDNQSYMNGLVRRRIEDEECEFKNIIERIEIYETGIVCILNNGFELSVQF